MKFATGLHHARVQRGIDLTDLAARTRLSPVVVQRIDEGRFDELPAGVYARAYIRAFASEVGLDPKEVLEELEPILPAVDDPLDGLREAARQTETSSWFIDITGRLAAAGVDAFILLVLDALVIHLVAATCGVSVGALLDRAAVPLATMCAVPVALYFFVFEGLGGRTPGATICNVAAVATGGPLGLRAIVMRTVFGAEPGAGPHEGHPATAHDPRDRRSPLRITNDADEQLA